MVVYVLVVSGGVWSVWCGCGGYGGVYMARLRSGIKSHLSKVFMFLIN